MQFRVRLMRRRGVRLQRRDVLNGPSVLGDVRTHIHQCRREPIVVMAVFDASAPVLGPLLQLYQPNLVGMFVNALIVRGFEAGGFAQEWHLTPC